MCSMKKSNNQICQDIKNRKDSFEHRKKIVRVEKRKTMPSYHFKGYDEATESNNELFSKQNNHRERIKVQTKANKQEEFSWLPPLPLIQVPLDTLKGPPDFSSLPPIYKEDLYSYNRKSKIFSLKATIYIFLEHPEGWKCFLYHFGV